jgi:hypothetical protein
MIWEGLVEQGLAVTRMIHDRYHASRRNPFNEIECSSHMRGRWRATGVPRRLRFRVPRTEGTPGLPSAGVSADFRCAFIAAEGWGHSRNRPRADDSRRRSRCAGDGSG